MSLATSPARYIIVSFDSETSTVKSQSHAVTISRLRVIYSAENGFFLQQAEKQCNTMSQAQIHTHTYTHINVLLKQTVCSFWVRSQN